MSKAILSALVLAACPLVAQNLTLAVTASTARTHVSARATPIPDNSATYNYVGAQLQAFGLEASWSFVNLPLGALAVTGLYEPQAQRNLEARTTRSDFIGPLPTTTTSLRFSRSVAGIGFRWEGSAPLVWSLGLSWRSEAVKLENGYAYPGADANHATLTATTLRPWLQGRLGTTFQGLAFKPLLALTCAMKLARRGATSHAFDTDLAWRLAPDSQLGAEVGVRF